MHRGYDTLENGLQPLDVLNDKYDHESQEEFPQAIGLLHRYHEAADCIYYAACIDEQLYLSDRHQPLPGSWYQKTLVECSRAMNVSKESIEVAALAKYEWRASGKRNKDEMYELSLIEQAIR